MIWPRCVTSIGISRLCKGLMLLALLKLCVIGVAAWDGGLTDAGPARAVVAAVAQPAQALAQDEETKAKDEEPAAKETKDDKAEAEEPSSASALNRQELLAKQDELARREAALAQLEQDLDAKLVRLHELEARLSRMLEQADALKDKKMQHLVNVYSNMKSKQAAQVLETLDEAIAVKILAGMQGRQAGEVLTFVNPKKAAKLSEALTKLQTQY